MFDRKGIETGEYAAKYTHLERTKKLFPGRITIGRSGNDEEPVLIISSAFKHEAGERGIVGGVMAVLGDILDQNAASKIQGKLDRLEAQYPTQHAKFIEVERHHITDGFPFTD